MNKDMDEILLGHATSDVAVRREVVKNVLYKATDLISVGTRVIPVVQYSGLDINMTFPDEGVVAEYPVPEGANADETALTWTEYTYSLKKAEVRFVITDESNLRGIAQQQNRRSMQRGIESLAKKKDANIISTLFNGAGQTEAVTTKWNESGGDPANDIIGAYGLISENTNVGDAELSRIFGILPAKAYTILMQLREIGNVNQRLRDWLQTGFGITFMMSRDSTIATTGLMVVNSLETAEHGVLASPGFPLAEDERKAGIGTKWTVRQFFSTKVVPESDSTTTSKRIVKFGTTV